MWWLFGMPVRVRAHLQFGATHDIEVEDSATAYLEYADGATGVFISSTGEAPGTNRLEVAAERGRIVIEGDHLQWTRNTVEMSAFSRTSPNGFARPETWHVTIPTSGRGAQHNGIIGDVVQAISAGAPLLAPGAEGIHGVELGNAMLMSHLWGRTVDLPLDADAVAVEYARLIAGSRHKPGA